MPPHVKVYKLYSLTLLNQRQTLLSRMPKSLLSAVFAEALRMGGIEYERMGAETSGEVESGLPKGLGRLHRILKGLAQMQIFLGLAGLALGSLADYVASANGGLRVPCVPEVCALYFIVSGLIGVCGSASLRRGLVTAFVVMSLHSVLFFVPFLLASSAASLVLSHRDCYLQTPPHSLNILCGQSAVDFMEGNPDVLSAVQSDDRLEWGLVILGVLQFALAVGGSVVGMFTLCESFGHVDLNAIQHINKLTAYGPRVVQSEGPVASVSGHLDA